MIQAEIQLIDLPPRSLLILRGPSRYAYTHAIRPRRADPGGEWGEVLRPRGERYSLTFRTVRDIAGEGGCKCEWGSWCDTRIAAEVVEEEGEGT